MRTGVDLRAWLIAARGHGRFDRLQSCFDALQLSAMLRRLLGRQTTHLFFVLKPAPEPGPKHREEHDAKGCFDQQRFLEGEDIDNAVLHINLRIFTDNRAYITNVVI